LGGYLSQVGGSKIGRVKLTVLTPIPVPLDEATKRPAFEPGEYYEVTNGVVSRMVLGELLLDDDVVRALPKYFLPGAHGVSPAD
jgi:hypothetical protein